MEFNKWIIIIHKNKSSQANARSVANTNPALERIPFGGTHSFHNKDRR